MRKELLPQLSIRERDRRWLLLRQEMARKGLDCLFIWGNNRSWGVGMANIRYITHVGCREAIALLPPKGEPVCFAGNPHYYEPYNIFASSQSWVSDVRPLAGVGPVAEAIEEMGLEKGKFGIIDSKTALSLYTVPYELFKNLMEKLPGINFVNFTDDFERIRMVKSAEEISFLDKAGQIANRMVKKMMEVAAPGVRECEVYAEMTKELLVSGGEDYCMNLFDSGPVGSERAHLLHGKENPLTPTLRELKPGDVVMTEFHSNYGGYLCGVEKTLSLGVPGDDLRRIHDVALKSFEQGTRAMRPGARFGSVVEAFRKPVAEAGMDYIELGIHGHGMASPEAPTSVYKPKVAHTLTGGEFADLLLEENMVFGTNIDIYDPKWRNDVGVMFGDTIQVTQNGPRRFCNTPYELYKI